MLKGSGKPKIIICKYNNKILKQKVEIGQKFFSSGMGGIYPKGILIGKVIEIREVDENFTEFDISLISSPLASNVVGVLKGL